MLDMRRNIKLFCLAVGAGLGVFNAQIPPETPWWVRALMGGLAAALLAINGFLDKGAAQYEQERRMENMTEGLVLSHPTENLTEET